MAKKMRKKVWEDFEITKVKLNPEQAVLSCCETPGRGMISDGIQCHIFVEGCLVERVSGLIGS